MKFDRTYNWTAWKAAATERGMSLQFKENADQYEIYGYDELEAHGTFIWIGEVPWQLIESGYTQNQNDADKADFEANFKATGNKKISPVKLTALNDPFANPNGYKARFKGFGGTAAKGTTTNIQLKLTEERRINGVRLLLRNHVWGDKLHFEVVDVDNILGYGAGVVLDRFGEDWYVDPDRLTQPDATVNYPAKILANLYIRVVYVSVGTETDVEVKANLFLHKKTG